jgi:hypothetical protein
LVGGGDCLLFRINALAARLLQAFVSFVYRLQQLAEMRRFLHRPQPVEGGAKQRHIPLRQQSHSHDTVARHPVLTRVGAGCAYEQS